MKRILVFLILAAMLLCGCTNTAVKNDNGSDNSISESTSAVTEETLPSGSEPAKTDEIVSVQEESAEVSTNTTSSESEKTAFPAPSELQNRPDGKEVSIFKDNTFDCDYSGYKEIGYDFGDLRFSVKAPETWNSFRFYGEDEIYQNIFIGFPLYDDPLDVKIVTSDDSTKFANDPLNK